MCPDRSPHRQQGAGLPVAIFVVTALALIVVGMTQLQESSSLSIGYQVQSQRAFFAAESGAQVGVARVLQDESCGAFPSTTAFATGGLARCTASLSCEALQADIRGDSAPETVYSLTSQGQCGSGADYAQRIVEVRVQ